MTSKRYTRTLMASLATMLTLNFLLPRAALAATPPEPHPTTTATLTDSTDQLFNGLYAPTGPDTWCQLGMAATIQLNDNQTAGINSTGCQIVGPDDGGLSVVGQNSNADHPNPPFFTTCQGEQGPANEADIDPSGVAIHCTNYDGEGENAYVHINLAGPGFSAHTDASTVWADLYGTSGYLGNGTYTVTGTGSTQTLSITIGGNTVTLSPPPAFTQATGWVEITTDTTTQCLYIDNAPPSCGGHTSWITDLDIGGAGSPSPAPYQWWGYGAWQDAVVAAVADPPTWADFGSLGCPGVSGTLCAAVNYDGTPVVPANCADAGTIPTTGVDAGDCTWADLPAYWFAMINEISLGSAGGAYEGTGPAGTACPGGVIMPLTGDCKPGIGTIPLQDCSADSLSLDIGADFQWFSCNFGNVIDTIANWALIAVDAIIDLIYPNIATLQTQTTTLQATLNTHIPFNYIGGSIADLIATFASISPVSPDLSYTFFGHTENIDLTGALSNAEPWRPLMAALVWLLFGVAMIGQIRRWFNTG